MEVLKSDKEANTSRTQSKTYSIRKLINTGLHCRPRVLVKSNFFCRRFNSKSPIVHSLSLIPSSSQTPLHIKRKIRKKKLQKKKMRINFLLSGRSDGYGTCLGEQKMEAEERALAEAILNNQPKEQRD